MTVLTTTNDYIDTVSPRRRRRLFNATKKRVTVVVSRVRRRLKKHMRLLLIVAPVNRYEEQYFTSHTYICRERDTENRREAHTKRKRNY
jgi:hypothetical protein